MHLFSKAFLIIILSTNILLAQKVFENLKYQAESGIYVSSSSQNPFWVRSNQYGIVPLESQFLTVRGSVTKEYDSTYIDKKSKKIKRFGYGYVVNPVINVGKVNQVLLPEAHIKVRYGAFEFYGGRKREIIGLVDTSLTSGSYIWSGNAMPIPKIQIAIPNYTPITKNGLIAIKGAFAHGWFGNQEYTKNYYLHQKWLYGRLGKPNWKVKLYGGMNHNVQWGGYNALLINKPYASLNGFLPSDFNAFLNAVFPSSFTAKAFPTKIQLNYDSLNYGGNQLGSVDFALELKLKNVKLLLYREIPYDVGSLFSSLVNADDGLYGISFKFNKPLFSINKIVLEGFHTFNQGRYRSNIARVLNIKDNHFGELHDYFNHGQYNDGWSYNRLTIGTPFIMNNTQLRNNIYYNIYSLSSYNQVKFIYCGIEGKINKLNYGLKTNYSLYRRSGYKIYPKFSQFSYMLYTSFPLRDKFNIKISQATDNAGIVNKNYGLSVSILRTW